MKPLAMLLKGSTVAYTTTQLPRGMQLEGMFTDLAQTARHESAEGTNGVTGLSLQS